MPIKIKVEHDIGDTLYIRLDPDQLPHALTGVVILPGAIKYILSYLGEEYTVYNFETSKEADPTIALSLNNKTDDDE